MKSKVSVEHPLRLYIQEMLHETLSDKLMRQDDQDVEAYMADLMLRFLHKDAIYAIKDPQGKRLYDVSDMLIEADIRLNANSFERERQVHRHIGDFILFNAGLFPESFGTDDHQCRLLNHIRQAKFSYELVSSFTYGKYATEAPTFNKLSKNFETYATVYRLMRVSFRGFGLEGWLTDMAA
jgi:hypothetical protein